MLKQKKKIKFENFDKYATFITEFIFKAFIMVAFISLISGILELIISSVIIDTIFLISFIFLAVFSTLYIYITFRWENEKMAEKNRRIILPTLLGLILVIIINCIIRA